MKQKHFQSDFCYRSNSSHDYQITTSLWATERESGRGDRKARRPAALGGSNQTCSSLWLKDLHAVGPPADPPGHGAPFSMHFFIHILSCNVCLPQEHLRELGIQHQTGSAVWSITWDSNEEKQMSFHWPWVFPVAGNSHFWKPSEVVSVQGFIDPVAGAGLPWKDHRGW